MQKHIQIFRGTICHITGDPFRVENENSVLESFADGGLAVDEKGRIIAAENFNSVRARHPEADVIDRSGCILLPGFIDCHIHFPQAFIVAAFGAELIDWLNTYIFPEEAKYKDPDYAAAAADLFFREEIAQGTTTGLIFGSHVEQATDLAFAKAESLNFRCLMGMTLHDRNVPDELKTTPELAYKACNRLIEKWHGQGKSRYVITPRFAPTCSSDMLACCGKLLKEHDGLYFQTHLNENPREVDWVRELFPESGSYLDVYDTHGLTGPRSLFAHAIYSSDHEISRLKETSSRVIHCPSSNSFLGSGLMPLKKYIDAGINVCMGTDIGAGTSFSMLKEMNQAYKVQMLLSCAMGQPAAAIKLTGIKLLYLATAAGARALSLETEAGTFKRGTCADLVVVDPDRDPFFKRRIANAESMSEKLFLMGIIGSKSLIREVYIDGRLAYGRQPALPDPSSGIYG